MDEQKQYPSCQAEEGHLTITPENTDKVKDSSNIIYFMTSDGAHKYWEEQQS